MCLFILHYLHREVVRIKCKHCELLGGEVLLKFPELFHLLKWLAKLTVT